MALVRGTTSRLLSITRRSGWQKAEIGGCSFRSLHSLRVLFFGTDSFSLPVLQLINQYRNKPSRTHPSKPLIESVEVVCPGPRKRGRGRKPFACSVHEYAIEHQLGVIEVPEGVKSLKKWEESPVEKFEEGQFDIGVVVSFGFFIPPSYLTKMKLGALNVHPSLLPKYRGPAPIHHALLNGDKETGLSIIEVSPKAFDVGAIFHQEKLTIGETEMRSALTSRLRDTGANAIISTLLEYEDRKNTAIVQENIEGCRAPKVEKEMAHIEFNATSSIETSRIYRALAEDFGGIKAVAEIPGKEALILKLTHLDLDLNNHSMPEDLEVCPPGSVLLQGKGPTSTLVIRTTDGCVRATKVRPHGRKEQSADGFVNGYLSAHPTRRRVEGGWVFEGVFR